MDIDYQPRHKHMIMAAANLVHCYGNDGKLIKTYTIVDNCHFGNQMQAMYKLFDALYAKTITTFDDQGFIDNHGCYHNRADAYKIARNSGQPFNDEYTHGKHSGDPELDSSCICHFESKLEWSDYMKGESK